MNKKTTIKRTIFAIIFILIVLPAFLLTYYVNGPGKIAGAVIFILIGMVGLYEIFVVMNMKKVSAILMSTILPAVFFLPWTSGVTSGIKDIISHGGWKSAKSIIKIAFWDWKPWVVSVLYILLPYCIDSNFRKNKNLKSNFCFLVLILFLIPSFAKGAWVVSIVDLKYSVFLLLIPIISDTLGYFGGMLFGKLIFKGKKFAPKISPKKTWAGFLFALFFTLIFSIIAGYYSGIWSESFSNIGSSILVGIILSMIAPLGDLFFSLIKRVYNKKDFSNLIPGHGGIFDRLDSSAIVIFVAIIFIFIL